jgi:hypothetical protein
VSATFVGNGVNCVERDALFQSPAICNRDQVDYLTLEVHPYNEKYFITAIDPDSLSYPWYSHNSYTHLYLVDP